jgi:CO/xanthine dehydrogenase Mo-binding subunit
VLYDGGAYAAAKGGPRVLPGAGYAVIPYRCPNVQVDITAVYTNSIPGNHVRAPADIQIAFAWESHADLIARGLGLDPIAWRQRNVIGAGEPGLCGEKMREPMGGAVLARLRELTAAAPAPGRGRGIALSCRHTGGGSSTVRLRLEADGTVAVLTGTADQGAGQLTVARRIVAATLGVPEERVQVVRGSTAAAPFDLGTGGSRITHALGRAAQAAATELNERMPREAAPIEVTASYEPPASPEHEGDYTFTATALEVAVDRATGATTVHDALIVSDVGAIVNPLGHQGQIDGGFVCGLGTALIEELVVDDDGRVLTANLGDYKLPTIADVPPLRTVLVESAAPGPGPFGAKMAGELSTAGVPPAIANAVQAASGARVTVFPLTPERVFEAIASGRE